jgi:hypothetical protein
MKRGIAKRLSATAPACFQHPLLKCCDTVAMLADNAYDISVPVGPSVDIIDVPSASARHANSGRFDQSWMSMAS